MTDIAQFSALIEPVAKILLGEPNWSLSKKGREWRYGSRGSLCVDLQKGVWADHETGEGGGLLDLIERQTGLHEGERWDWLEQNTSYKPEPRPNGGNGAHQQKKPQLGPIVETFDYVDEGGEFLSQVTKHDPKDFRQRTRDAKGDWTWSVKGVRPVPYRLPELIEAVSNHNLIAVVEGEKDANNCWRISIPATCNAGGAGKWRSELNAFFEDADVVIIPDNDLPGQAHARKVAEQLKPIAYRVRMLDLKADWPDMPVKADVSDWLAHGGTADRLYALIEQLPDWTSDQQPQQAILRATQYIVPDPATIPVRQWLYGLHYMRGIVTATVAPGGFGKTTLSLYEAITMTVDGHRVWYISGEDDRAEIDRRIAAHLKKHEIEASKLGHRLFVDDKASFPLKIAKMNKTGILFDDAAVAAFEAAIVRDKIDVVVLDPFISFHYLAENDTAAMDGLVKRLGEIALRQACCIELSHHVRKPTTGQSEITVYDARGAGAIVNAVRSCRVLNHMPREVAEAASINPDERSSYIRIDSGKRNMAPPESARWSRLVNITIANGDKVQALEGWKFSATNIITEDDKDWLRAAFRSQPHHAFRVSSQATNWIGCRVAQRYGRALSEKADIVWIHRKLKNWKDEGLIERVEDMLDPSNRKKCPHWVCGPQLEKEESQSEKQTRQVDELFEQQGED
jgi:hypothetical protein